MTDQQLTYGLHHDVPAQRYHRRTLGHVSKSGLDQFHRSPLHYQAWVNGELDRDTPALSFGRAFHCSVLEPDRFATEYAVTPDFGDCRFKEAKAARDAWRNANEGAEHLDPEDAANIDGMRSAVMRHPLAGRMIRDGMAEVTLCWQDQDTGLTCKSRADYYVKKLAMVLDLKSTDDASPAAFARSIYKYRYHVQDALYRSGFAAVDEPIQHFVLIAVEKTKPYAVGTYALDADAIGRGYSSARRDIDGLAECVRANRWPGYPETIQQIELPPWAE
jgi:exodeoxyribonuclease VIII